MLEVTYTPQAPLIRSTVPALSASCGVPFRYPLRAHAPAATAFTLAGGPAQVDAATGELTWTPAKSDRGAHSFAVEAGDGSRTENLDVEISVECSSDLKVGFGCSSAGLSPLLLLGLALLRAQGSQRKLRFVHELPPRPSRTTK
jgi:hypothetical protein